MSMNKLITLPIAMLMVMTFVGVVMAMSGFTIGPVAIGDTNTYLNGTQAMGWSVTTWDLTSVTALLAVVAALALLVAFLGITVLGSSILSDTGQAMLFKTLGYFGLYLALSAGAGWAFNSIPIWGNVAYLMLTTMFALGFMMDIQPGGA